MSEQSEDLTENKVIRILALHGKYGNGQSFRTFLEPLTSSLQKKQSSKNVVFEWDYLTAPFAMPDAGEGEQFEWWKLPPNTRSFNAKEYIGYDVSKQMIVDALSSKQYHVVMGHSQGAILLSSILSSLPHDLLLDTDDTAQKQKDQQQQIKSPMAYIFNGAAWPNPFTAQLESLSSNLSSTTTPVEKKKKALFIIGKRDAMNPPEGAERVKQSLEDTSVLNIQTCYHDGGHSVPVKNDNAMNEIISWILSLV